MKFEEINLNSLLFGENLYPYDYISTEKKDVIKLKSRPHEVECWKCGAPTRSLASNYVRTLQEIPVHFGRPTYLEIKANKYYDENPDCPVCVFNETLDIANPQQRRTIALDSLILAVSLFVSEEGASRILGYMGVKITADAIHDLWERIEIPDDPDIEEIGVDDLSSCRGQSYLTAVYSGKDHSMLALLDGRDGKEFKNWLLEHPKIKRVARDRATAYAKAIFDVLQDCIQVADRFHLFQNLSKHLKDIFMDEMPNHVWIDDEGQVVKTADEKDKYTYEEKSVNVAGLSYDEQPPVDKNGQPLEIDASLHSGGSRKMKKESTEKRKKKQELIRSMQKERLETGKNVHQLALKWGVAPPTAKKYLLMTEEEIQTLDNRQTRLRNEHKGDKYIPIIYKMMADGHDDVTILSYLRQTGVTDPLGTIARYLRAVGENHFPDRHTITDSRSLKKRCLVPPVEAAVPFTRIEILHAIQTIEPKKREARAELIGYLPAMAAAYPAVSLAMHAFEDFHDTIMGKDSAKLDVFLETFSEGPLESFCNGIRRDYDAVQNAIKYEISSGYVEGDNNLVKLIERTGFGKYKTKSLERKCKVIFYANANGLLPIDLMIYHRRRPSWAAA